MTTKDPDCFMVFYYHINGAAAGGLDVKLTEVGSTTKTTVWSVNGSANATVMMWEQAVVRIGQRSLFKVNGVGRVRLAFH